MIQRQGFPSGPRAAMMPFSSKPSHTGKPTMVERRKELDQRYQRKKKMGKLKAKLAAAKDARERDVVLKKIHVISPWWKEPAKTPA